MQNKENLPKTRKSHKNASQKSQRYTRNAPNPDPKVKNT